MDAGCRWASETLSWSSAIFLPNAILPLVVIFAHGSLRS